MRLCLLVGLAILLAPGADALAVMVDAADREAREIQAPVGAPVPILVEMPQVSADFGPRAYETPHYRYGIGDNGTLRAQDATTLRAGASLPERRLSTPVLGDVLLPSLGARVDGSRIYTHAPSSHLDRIEAELARGAGGGLLPGLPPLPPGTPDAPRPASTSGSAADATPAPGEPPAARALAAKPAVPAPAPFPLAAAAAGAALVLLAPWTLYHRLRGRRLLQQETRARLYETVRAEPGIAPAEAARALGVDPSTIQYHLRRLVADGLVVAEGPARTQRYFAAGSVPAPLRARVVAARDGAALLEALGREALSKTELAGRLHLSRPSLAWHLARLERAGLVRSHRMGRQVVVRREEAALAALQRLASPRPSPPEAF